ncbi:hypothetical protein V5O48_007870 [Marasmius crinis-equi]|uniref:Chitinase n=1 Tax=Marasmius crinis-equi TaxID=585013 RepID=A0ABR3FFM5_9AGAR
MPLSVTIPSHTTSSFPRPHILYTLHVSKDGKDTVLNKRYSDFIALNTALGSNDIVLPPKRILVTTFIPSAWMDDALIQERKSGLAKYLSNLIAHPDYQNHPALLDFLDRSSSKQQAFNFEDALPSTLSRKAALDLGKKVEAEANFTAAAYYPDWSADSNPPEKIDFSKFDVIFFAFAIPNQSSGLNWDPDSQNILRRLVSGARNSGKGTRIVLSVGGWGGSQWFSQAVTSQNRSVFVNALVSAVNSFNLDVFPIRYQLIFHSHSPKYRKEYPNSTGAGNPHSPSDAANLLSLFKDLRTALGPARIISAAVPHLPWIGENGKPLTNISAYAEQMTFINIMNYDVWGASANPGPNAPLSNACGTSSQPEASAQAALEQWTAAGAPAGKLLLGLPLYGYVSQSSKTTLSGSFAPTEGMVLLQESELQFLNGAHPRKKPEETVKAEATDLRSWYGQQIPFNVLVSSGALVKQADGNYGEGGGFTMGWDDCSDTPYLYNTSQQTVVTYDDTWSIGDKASFAKDNGMAGCFTWSLDQDDGLTLQNVIRKNLGKQ